jgi:hypothetical protein
VAWIDELTQILVAKIVVVKGKHAEMQRKNINQSKLNPVGLMRVDCFYQLIISGCKASLL